MPLLNLATEDTQHDVGMRMRSVNMYVEPTPQGPDPSIRLPRPGLVSTRVLGVGPVRCTFEWNNNRFTVSGENVFYNNVNIGVIPGADLCRFALSDDEVVIVGSQKAYYITATSVAIMTDPDLPVNIVDVLFLAGRFVYLDFDSAKFVWSDIGDARNVDGLSFATAAENAAQNLIGGGVLVDQIVFYLETEVEWWYSADDPDNPFQYSAGRKYNKGLASRDTICLLDNTLFFLGSDRIVYRASTVPTRVSSFSLEDKLQRLSVTDLAACTAFTFTFGGHTFYIINLPGLGSWALDVATNKWNEWKSWGKDRFRVNCSDGIMMGDLYTGNLMQFGPRTYLDLGDPIERITSAFLALKAGALRCFNLYLKCVRGVGLTTGYGSDPKVEMRFSDTEGNSFSNWLEAPLGIEGDRGETAKAIWTQLGKMDSPGRLFEFRCTDPVYFCPSQVKFNEPRP